MKIFEGMETAENSCKGNNSLSVNRKYFYALQHKLIVWYPWAWHAFDVDIRKKEKHRKEFGN